MQKSGKIFLGTWNWKTAIRWGYASYSSLEKQTESTTGAELKKKQRGMKWWTKLERYLLRYLVLSRVRFHSGRKKKLKKRKEKSNQGFSQLG